MDRSPRFPLAHTVSRWDGFSCGCEEEPHSSAQQEADYFDFAHPATPEEAAERRRRGLLLLARERIK